MIDPEVLIDELDGLESRGVDTSGLRISGNAHLIMPWHRSSTPTPSCSWAGSRSAPPGAGSAPPTPRRRSRVGIRVQDLLDEKILRLKIQTALSVKNLVLRKSTTNGRWTRTCSPRSNT